MIYDEKKHQICRHCGGSGRVYFGEEDGDGIPCGWCSGVGFYKPEKNGNNGGNGMKAVRVEYWVQDTKESGRWVLTGLLKKQDAEKCVHLYDRGRIVDNDEDY